MNEIKIFNNPQFGAIRTLISDSGDPLFCAMDITTILGYRNGRKAIIDNCKTKGVTTRDTLTKGGHQSLSYIDKSNLYRLILKSKNPEAEQFESWVCEEILPSIRKNGGYIQSSESDTPELIMARALILASETIKRVKSEKELLELNNKILESKNSLQEMLLDHQAPMVRFSQAVETSENSCLVSEMAKIISQNGIEIGRNRLFTWLRLNGYLCSKGDYYNHPTQKAMELKLFELKKSEITLPNGAVFVNVIPRITGKGQIYFINKFIPKLEMA